MGVNSTLLPVETEFKLLTSGQFTKTITDPITRNTFIEYFTIDVSKVPFGRLYPLIYAVDQSGNFLSRDTALIPDVGFTVTVAGTDGGLSPGTLVGCNAEWYYKSGIIHVGMCPPKWSGLPGVNTEHLEAPYVIAYYVWFIFYV
jgi:hypothetical protein